MKPLPNAPYQQLPILRPPVMWRRLRLNVACQIQEKPVSLGRFLGINTNHAESLGIKGQT